MGEPAFVLQKELQSQKKKWECPLCSWWYASKKDGTETAAIVGHRNTCTPTEVISNKLVVFYFYIELTPEINLTSGPTSAARETGQGAQQQS